MSDRHRRVFELQMIEQDGGEISQAQRAELNTHLTTCPTCQANRQIYQRLQAEAGNHWPAASVALPKAPKKVRPGAQPWQTLILTGLVLLLLVILQWIFTNLRLPPAVLPPAGPTPEATTPMNAPGDEAGKLQLQPLLAGQALGTGSWSPAGDYFFIPLMEAAGSPGSDRRVTRLHFIAANTGQDCPASETFLGAQGSQNYVWLDAGRLLFIDAKGRSLLFKPCQAGSEDLSERFNGPLVRIAQPPVATSSMAAGPLLLEAATTYWLLDPASLGAHPLADPLPSPDLTDSIARLPSGRQVSIIQPVSGQPGRSRLVLIDLESGQALRSLEVEASAEGRGPMVEWLGPERPFVWSLSPSGPLMLNLASDPPGQVQVLAGLFGLGLTYPDQMSSMGVVYPTAGENFHIVAHLNLPDDRSIFVFHGEDGKVENLAGDKPVLLVFPGDQYMALVPWQDAPSYEDEYELVWIDEPQKPAAHLQVSGHTPRNIANLQSRLLPGGERILFGSTQGISLVGLPNGETLAFWQLIGAENAVLPSLSLAPDGQTLIVVAHLSLNEEDPTQANQLYWLRLDE